MDLDGVSIKDDSVRVELNKAGVVFEGKRSKDGKEISGDFKQAGRSFPLTVKKVTTADVGNRSTGSVFFRGATRKCKKRKDFSQSMATVDRGRATVAGIRIPVLLDT